MDDPQILPPQRSTSETADGDGRALRVPAQSGGAGAGSAEAGPAESRRAGESLAAAVRAEHPAEAAFGGARWLDLRAWVRDVVISVVIAAIVIVFLYQPVKVEGTSMMPWLTDQERIFVNKFVYRFEDINRGDIVVFWFPLDQTKSYIKRVVGLPGDVVEIRRGTVLVNGQVFGENYVPEQYRDNTSYPPVKVPPDHYYVLGDHRNASNDSRTWKTVERRLIYGKAVFVYWPLDRFGVLR